MCYGTVLKWGHLFYGWDIHSKYLHCPGHSFCPAKAYLVGGLIYFVCKFPRNRWLIKHSTHIQWTFSLLPSRERQAPGTLEIQNVSLYYSLCIKLVLNKITFIVTTINIVLFQKVLFLTEINNTNMVSASLFRNNN